MHLLERACSVAGPLAEVCRKVSASLLASQPHTIPGHTMTDSGLPGCLPVIGTDFNHGLDHLAMARMTDSLAGYLEDPNQPLPHLDDHEARCCFKDFPMPSTFSSKSLCHYTELTCDAELSTRVHPICKAQGREENPEWFPWPNRVVSMLRWPFPLHLSDGK